MASTVSAVIACFIFVFDILVSSVCFYFVSANKCKAVQSYKKTYEKTVCSAFNK